MTITIPTWLLYTLYGLGGIISVLIVGFILGLAFMGWVLMQSLKGGIWR